MLIDIVYTWVDGSDPIFAEKKNKFIDENFSIDNPHIRFENINEIYYSIKSVLKYIPWINKIYIVTDNQIPQLDDDIWSTGKINIIDHKTIIPEEYLPTFYSDVIESFLHNIPNLSEIFLYNNDDTFFLDYINVSDIIEEKNGYINLKIRSIFNIDLIRTKKSEYSKRIIKTYNILSEISNKKLVNNHHTKILRKSTLKFIEKEFEGLLKELRSYRFRNSNTIQYLFFAINVDNIYNDNIILENPSDVKELHFGSYDFFNENLAHKFNIYKKYKFCCLNSMNYTFKNIFEFYIKHFL